MNPLQQQLLKYMEKDLTWKQLMEVGWGIAHGLNEQQVNAYAKERVSYEQMRAYREALEKGMSIETVESLQEKNLYDWEIQEILNNQLVQRKEAENVKHNSLNYWQQQQIRYGMRDDLEVSLYADAKYTWRQMKEIRLGLEMKIDVSKYADARIDFKEMKAIREGLEKNIDISRYWQPAFNRRQIREIRMGVVRRLPVSVYAKANLSANQMRELRKGLQQGIDVKKLASPEYSWEMVREACQRQSKLMSVNKLLQDEQEDEWEI